MPCRSDYMEPTDKQKQLKETAKLYIYVLECLGKTIPVELRKAANTYYCTDDYVPVLCEALHCLSDKELDEIVYNARNKTSRQLADWWETHQEADKARFEKEKEETRNKVNLINSGLSKLTDEEKKALGL